MYDDPPSLTAAFGERFVDEPVVDEIDDTDFAVGAGHQYDPVSLQALVFAASQFTFRQAMLVDQETAKAVACWTTLSEPKLDESALACEHGSGESHLNKSDSGV